MKSLVLLTALILLLGSAFGQALPKGTMIGTHELTITLSPGVTLEQYIQFFTTKYLPENNKFDPDWQVYLFKGVRGSKTNTYALMHVVKSEQTRAKYYNADGTTTELAKSWIEKMKPVSDEMKKLGTYKTVWTDWIVQ